MDLLVNSQNSSVDLLAIHLDVPRNYFEVVDMDANAAGVQPFADSTGAFKTFDDRAERYHAGHGPVHQAELRRIHHER